MSDVGSGRKIITLERRTLEMIGKVSLDSVFEDISISLWQARNSIDAWCSWCSTGFNPSVINHDSRAWTPLVVKQSSRKSIGIQWTRNKLLFEISHEKYHYSMKSFDWINSSWSDDWIFGQAHPCTRLNNLIRVSQPLA